MDAHLAAYLLEWLNLLGRWVHMITGIAWIGASFYFVWLDNHLLTPVSASDTERGVSGEVWSVHGGGFYHAQKYQVAPPELPATLNWFKWEAYTTWITGMFMLILMYWFSAEVYLLDPSVSAISKPVAIVIGAASLVCAWFTYDQLCKSRLGKQERLLSLVMLVLLTLAAWLLCQLFSGRGAFMHFGAMLGTIMVANVFFVIIPGQKDLVAAKKEGRTPDPIHGINGKQRSVHNTYFTLPVLFVMISHHYALVWSHAWNWLILVAISVAGALIRVYFVARHRGSASPWPLLSGLALLVVTAALVAPRSSQSINSPSAEVSAAQAQAIVLQRCAGCHAQAPTQPGFASAPKGIHLETAQQIESQAALIYQQSVVTRAMPVGNLTGMTDEERAMLGSWFKTLQ
ncbi:MAG: urate hydroxylase PuuD [Gammaproteobacteria bacterium]|nr:urate hydroxylase PuuD [Gammaproteobacteria bacterium]